MAESIKINVAFNYNETTKNPFFEDDSLAHQVEIFKKIEEKSKDSGSYLKTRFNDKDAVKKLLIKAHKFANYIWYNRDDFIADSDIPFVYYSFVKYTSSIFEAIFAEGEEQKPRYWNLSMFVDQGCLMLEKEFSKSMDTDKEFNIIYDKLLNIVNVHIIHKNLDTTLPNKTNISVSKI